ncbi:MAG: hypothetical protein HYV19_07080 [Gemmatimonadetes bacterium]|nr:hypothetical protein [Gemmatimonadota bacterium]
MRIRHSIVVAGAAFVAWSAPVQGQCAAGYTQDACQKTVDLFNFLTPQISTALSGGAATIGQGGVLGGFPHWTLGVRASAVNGSFPTMKDVSFSTTGAKASSYAAEDQYVPMATIDGSIGIYKGFPLGITRVGGIDALLSATYIPSAPEGGDITVSLPGGSTKWGGGVRVGLLQESILVPGVAFTYLQRGLPTLSVSGSSTVSSSAGSAPGTFELKDLTMKSKSWRVSASKSFMAFGLQAGAGQDTYDNSVGLDVTVNAAAPVGTQHASATASHSMKRTNMYIGGSLNFFIGRLVAEYGQVSGGSLPAAMNSFGSSPTASRSYFSVGLRTGF